jgi:hypothetical protein
LAQLKLNFYGELVEIESEWTEIIDLIARDFSYFKCRSEVYNPKKIQLKIYNAKPENVSIPQITTSMQTLSSLTYQVGDVRYNDYYGKLTSIFNYKTEKAEIYSLDLSKTHEVAYLFILSRVGKKLDILGLHKLHAFAVSYNDIAIVCMMPMKGGKSTLMLELLKNPSIKMISDDIPFINRFGEVLPCPIKVGLEKWSAPFQVIDPEKNIYQMQREHYGPKILICVEGFLDKIVKPDEKFKKIILIEAFRYNSMESRILKTSWLKTFKGLFKHGIVGIGLPMVVEYFWEFGIRDFFIKSFIFCSRLTSFFIFSLRAKKFQLNLGKESGNAAAEILKIVRKCE